MLTDLLKKLFPEPTLAARPDHQLASIALLVEIAMADGQLDDDERDSLAAAIEKSHGLSGAELNTLLSNATQQQKSAISLFEFTRVINDEFSNAEKCELVADMWRVAYADGHLDKYEESMIRKLSELIYVSHSDFIRVKLQVRDSLAEI